MFLVFTNVLHQVHFLNLVYRCPAGILKITTESLIYVVYITIYQYDLLFSGP